MKALNKLVSISSASITDTAPVFDFEEAELLGQLGSELKMLLRLKNGFYAFESALHVFPASPKSIEPDLKQWNSLGLWRFEYGSLSENCLYFAEDAFGNQFCLHSNRVCTFDAETGEKTVLSDNIEQWADRILGDTDLQTGYPLLHQWQCENGALPVGKRLMPRIPFVLGGAYSLPNLYALGAVNCMKSRGNLASQLKNVPDGAKVEFRVVE